MKIYVASSWRNEDQPRVVNMLREHGHEVYDFRNPCDGTPGFQWEHVAKHWKHWDVDVFKMGLKHPAAIAGYERDMAALSDADVCLLVLPCGRSAHLEAGYAAASNKKLVLFTPPFTFGGPELMYNMCDEILQEWSELSAWAKQLKFVEGASHGSI